MADQSKIEWTDATWQPVTGCSIVSPGCTNCYAMKLAGTRLRHHPSRAGLTVDSKAGPVWNGKVCFNEQWLDQPLRWKSPRRIFVCAHGDLFHESVPDEWIDKVFAVMALAPQHTFQVLTKRSARMRAYMLTPDRKRLIAAQSMPISCMLARDGGHKARIKLDHFSACFAGSGPLPNVWLGVSTERQQEADERIPDLLQTPAAVRFISAEPLLGPIDLKRWMPHGKWGSFQGAPVYHQSYFMTKCDHCGWLGSSELAHEISYGDDADVACPQCNRIFICDDLGDGHGINWVIVGGESGAGARPMHPDWARALRDQCAAANVPFFFKQWGGWSAVYDRDRDDPDWRRCDVVKHETPKGQWLNIEGMQGFHNARVVRVDHVGKKVAGRLLDGVEHNGMPECEARPA